MFILDPASGIPIYRQLTDQVRRLVAGGQLRPGAELPSIRDLALKHAINPMTVSKAYMLLEQEGLLVRRRGLPMVVSGPSRAPPTANSRIRQLDPQLDQLILSAQQLGLSSSEVVKVLHERWKGSHGSSTRRSPTAG